jgi:hypothetical protein
MHKLIFSLLLTTLSGCSIVFSEISNKMGLYKHTSGFSRTVTEGEKWFELRYQGKEKESSEEAIEKWLDRVKDYCGSSYSMKPVLSLEKLLTPDHGHVEKVDSFSVHYPEKDNKKWPTVTRLVKCN